MANREISKKIKVTIYKAPNSQAIKISSIISEKGCDTPYFENFFINRKSKKSN